jgi:hypothetical protein
MADGDPRAKDAKDRDSYSARDEAVHDKGWPTTGMKDEDE